MNRQRRQKSRQFSLPRYSIFPWEQWRSGVTSLVISLVLSLLILKLNTSSLSTATINIFNPSTVGENLAGKSLDELEKQKIAEFLQIAPPETELTLDRTPLFILHDTAWSMTAGNIEEQKKYARGPMKLGPNVYIPRKPNSRDRDILDSIARPFFERHRPTATFYEQAAEMLPADTRDQLVRQLWQLTPETIRVKGFALALAGVPLSTRSAPELEKRARIWLNTPSEAVFRRLVKEYPTNYFDGAKSTALWATEAICQQLSHPNCDRLQPVFAERNRRVISSVNIELVQAPGSHCLTKGRLQPLPGYSDFQYQQTAKYYLLAALQTGQLPQIVSHFAVDSFLINQGKYPHCDPRGFDLQRLYNLISQALGYDPGTVYGIVPRYGTNIIAGDNIWWHNQVFDAANLPTTLN
ncbi:MULTISPECIES: hypothetical protein [Microcystis]|uniref:Similarity n=1 Tax=Microcystis aeruginosa PCC 9701 TaxID=721123 RepID=I4IKJ4_MICAE|nr:hypothetical protein [Microcystis aeruginosa]CCI34818.1 Similarity [Microcystis aeruginosa PCC 9701]